MDKSLAVNPTPLADADACVRHYQNQSRSASTWRAYASDWKQFSLWCHQANLTPLPASPHTVASFIASQGATRSPSTLARRLAAIRLMHRGANFLSPHNDPVVEEVMRGIRNAASDKSSGARRPVCDEEVCAMAAACDPSTFEGLRNKALLLVGFAGALRRSELVALDVADIEQRTEGLYVTIRRSKSDQAGVGQTIAIPAIPGSAACPVTALDDWLNAALIGQGPLFRRLYRGDTLSDRRLSAQSVSLVVKAAAVAIGVDPARVAAHSLRHGFLTTAARNGADIFSMAAQSRHKDVRTVMRYVANESRFNNHPGANMLKG